MTKYKVLVTLFNLIATGAFKNSNYFFQIVGPIIETTLCLGVDVFIYQRILEYLGYI